MLVTRRDLAGLAAFFQGSGPRRIAALVSEYRPGSHADAIVGKVLDGLWYEGPRAPRLRVASMYTDQVPDEDMSRGLAAKHGFKLASSIREALTGVSDTSAGSRALAVDGVLLICEHGAYPYNALGRKLYPRFEFFQQVVDVFRETGRVAPVFVDKHFSHDWHRARRMYDAARELKIPLMAGSVEPLSRDPAIRLDSGLELERVVTTWQADFFDSKDSYGFHAIENLQSLIESRKGGETGVRAVQCLENAAVWEWTRETPWAAGLLGAAMAKGPLDLAALEKAVRRPLVFRVEYADGLEAAAYRLNGAPGGRALAAAVRGRPEPLTIATMWRPSPAVSAPADQRRQYPYNHFSATVHAFERLAIEGAAPNPVERTLLTTGVLAALFESSYQPAPMYGRSLQHGTLLDRGRRIETPHLNIAYGQPSAVSSADPWLPPVPADQAVKGWRPGRFASATLGREAGYWIYTPPGHDSGRERFPVVFWLHGFNGSPTSATPFLERLRLAVERGQAPRMIVVSCVDPLHISQWTDSKDGGNPVETVIVRDLVPHIEKAYRTIPGRAGRAIEGYSMGGYGAAYLGFKYPELFSAVSILAPGMLSPERMSKVRDGIIFDKIYGRDPDYAVSHSAWTVTRNQVDAVKRWKPLVRLFVGDRDISMDQSIQYHETLTELGIAHEWGLVPGAEHNTGQTFDLWPGNPFDFFAKAFPSAKR